MKRGALVKKVRLIFKTHLDIGFTDMAEKVKEKYFTHFITNAITTADYFRAKGGSFRYVWTVGAWLIREYLERANETQKMLLDNAIKQGDITWHALPFTMHCELMNTNLFLSALKISKELDQMYQHRTIAAKLTDVPGHTRGIIAPLVDTGIHLLHIGINPASAMPDVPPIFRWRDSHNKEILVVYQADYGQELCIDDTIFSIVMTGDNQGPHKPEQVEKILAQYPDCDIQSSTLDDLAAHLIPKWKEFPVITSEIGDSWIHGIGTDPWKVARFRELERFYAECGTFSNKSTFERRLLEVAEHTWGLCESVNYYSIRGWNDNDPNLQKKDARYFASSWAEQRALLTSAMAVLPENLKLEAQKRLKLLTPHRSRMRQKAATRIILENDFFTLIPDQHKGCLKSLVVKDKNLEFHNCGLFTYEKFSRMDYERFRRQYLRLPNEPWAIHDFTKPELPDRPHLTCAGFDSEMFVDKFRLVFVSKELGFFGHIETEFRLNGNRLEITLCWFDKVLSRLAQAAWVSFIQNTQPLYIKKLGELIEPQDVISKGGRALHAVQEVRYASGVSLISHDAPLLAPGKRSLLNFHNKLPQTKDGVHFNLYNNIWGTNFPMWFNDDMKFRFSIITGNADSI